MTDPLWTPSPDQIARSNMTAFLEAVRAGPGADAGIREYPDLWRWSVEHPERFWPAVWEFCGVIAEERADGSCWDEVVVGLDRMAPPDPQRGPRWFLGARLNFAENLLCHRDAREALVFWNETGRVRALTYQELAAEVAAFAAALRAHGVSPGDRIAGYLPNLPETVIAMLAAASLGAIWSSCSPDFGVKGVLDRFGR